MFTHLSNNHFRYFQIKRKLPKGHLIVAYATVGCSFHKIVNEVVAGVNVLVWFSSNLSKNISTGEVYILHMCM